MNNKNNYSLAFLLLAVTFVVCLIVANLTEIKTVDIGGWFTITAGVIVFPVSYIINDCVVEVYGFKRARMMILLGFVMSLVVALLLQLAIWLPGGPEWAWQQDMINIYGAVPRIMLASFTAFVIGSLINAYVMSVMKKPGVEPGHSGFRLRAIVSTVAGEGADSVLFFPIAFWGVLSLRTIVSLIVTQTIIKTVYELLVLPVTVRFVRLINRIENS